MNIISKTPGFRSQNIKKAIISILYYSFFIGTTLGSSNIKMACLYGSGIFIPVVIVKIKNIIVNIKNKEFKIDRENILYGLLVAAIVFSWYINIDNVIVKKHKLEFYTSLPNRIEKLKKEDLKYKDDNDNQISKYLDLRVKHEDVSDQFDKYKTEHPESIKDQVEVSKEEVNKYYGVAVGLENKIKAAKKEKYESQIASSSDYSSSSSNSSGTSGSSNNSNSSNNNSSNKHIGRNVYISNGNSYYHAIANCKYLEGASTSLVTLTSSMRKYECNCWTNPIAYKPSSNSSSSSNGGSSSGRTVYIASGNSYYHNSPSCKFLNGASAKAVGINNVGGKHACNCVKY